MITIIEAAKLSAHTYHPGKLIIFSMPINKFKQEMMSKTDKLSDWYIVTDNNHPMRVTTLAYFSAQLYLKFVNGKAKAAVIAIRGTWNWHNDIIDAADWINSGEANGKKDFVPPYFTPMMTYIHGARDYLKNVFGVNRPPLFFTGHSLGGAMAKLAVLDAGLAHTAITFNAPGVAHMPGIKSKLAGYIVDINARYDLVHLMGGDFPQEHIATIDVPEHESEAKEIFSRFDLKHYQHSKSFLNKADYLISRGEPLLNDVPRLKQKYEDCVDIAKAQVYISPYEMPPETSADCKVESLTKEETSIFYAQHIIDNIVKTLKESRYQPLANRAFFH